MKQMYVGMVGFSLQNVGDRVHLTHSIPPYRIYPGKNRGLERLKPR